MTRQPLKLPPNRSTLPQVQRSPHEGRIPPQAVDIEAQVLGAMLLEKSAIYKVAEILKPDHFYADHHRKIYQAILNLFEASEQADTITVAEELRKSGHLELVGGEVYLAELTMKITSSANVEYHARIVLEKALLRGLIIAASRIIEAAYAPTQDPLDLVAESQAAMFEIGANAVKKHFVSIRDGVVAAVEMLQKVHGVKDGLTGIPSGFRDIDSLTTGWQRGDLIIIAGRPSHGKTSIALNFADNAAKQEKPESVGIFSLEMSLIQLCVRFLCAEGKINGQDARKGRLTDQDWQRALEAAERLSKLGIYIDDSGKIGMTELRSKAIRLKSEKNIGLILVDYLQLMTGDKNAATREQEIASISRGLKALAKELDIPVIALSQLSRETERRKSAKMRPILSDLRDSGQIEQDADVVIFIHRPEMYFDKEEYKGMAEAIVAKQRNGPLDIIKLAFNASRSTFSNYSARDEQAMPLPYKDDDSPPF